MKLRDYQQDLVDRMYRSWDSGHANVIGVSPTGSGKTVVMADIVRERNERGVVIAHRAELVGQISLALSRFDIPHNIIGSSNVVKFCIAQQIAECGTKYHDPRAKVTVGAVDTIMARADTLGQWMADQRFWMIDECHHVLTNNKWGKVVGMFTRAHGAGFTATPVRADRKSLHHEQGGVFHDMILGPTMRDLINRGMLCDYRIFAPPMSIDVSEVKIGSTGDYSQPGLRQAAHKSKIVGDVVEHYLRLASGKRGITFTVDIEQANEIAAAYTAAGVPALSVNGETPDFVRAEAIRKFRDGRVLQLVNVDLFGEGFDVPAVEVVSMGRPTMSYGLFVQQFGRALRILEGKTDGLIIDHVGNVQRHGLPDAPRKWALRSEERGRKSNRDDEDVIPVTTCTQCFRAYENLTPVCPYCGVKAVPAGRSLPEQVAGDLIELDPATLARMRGEADRVTDVDFIPIPLGATGHVAAGIENRFKERAAAQHDLRAAIALWAGIWRDKGDDDHAIYRRFFHRFKTDIMTAQTLSRGEAEELKQRIESSW